MLQLRGSKGRVSQGPQEHGLGMPLEWKSICLAYVRTWIWKEEEEKREGKWKKKKKQHTLRPLLEFQIFKPLKPELFYKCGTLFGNLRKLRWQVRSNLKHHVLFWSS